MSKYYYQFRADTPEGKKLRSFHRACQKAEQEAERYAKKVGATSYYTDPKAYAGGVVAVVFKNDSEINEKMWRFLGCQEVNGEKLYTPNVTIAYGKDVVKAGKRPFETATKIYKNVSVDRNNDYEVSYISIETSEQLSRIEHARTITAEKWRLKLPIVYTTDFYRIVHADMSVVDGTSAPVKIEETTPVFFLYRDHYYIGLNYPIHNSEFEEIPQAFFNMKKGEMFIDERNKAQQI